MIWRNSAVEPAIVHMKADSKLAWNWLKGAMRAVLCGAGHNPRTILRKLRLLYAHARHFFSLARASVIRQEVYDSTRKTNAVRRKRRCAARHISADLTLAAEIQF